MFRSVDLPIQRSAKPHNHEPMSEYVFVLTQTHVKNQDLQQAQQLELGKKKKNRTQFGVKKKSSTSNLESSQRVHTLTITC